LCARSKTELWSGILSRGNRFSRLIADHDIIYIPGYCYPLVPLAKRLGKKVIVHLHDYLPVSYSAAVPAPYEQYKDFPNKIRSFNIWLESRKSFLHEAVASLGSFYSHLAAGWVGDADTVVCVSRRQAEIVGDLFPGIRHRIVVIYNLPPAIPNGHRSLMEYPTFIYEGGGIYHKGFHLFLKAAMILLSKGKKAHFILTSNLSDEGRFIVKSLNKKFDGAFKQVGRLPYEKVLSLLSRSHGLIFTSIWEEPLPYAIMESMLSGTVPIASAVGGVPEMVSGTYAETTLCEPLNMEDVASHIEVVMSLSNAELVDIGRQLSQSAATKFDRAKTVQKYLDILRA